MGTLNVICNNNSTAVTDCNDNSYIIPVPQLQYFDTIAITCNNGYNSKQKSYKPPQHS